MEITNINHPDAVADQYAITGNLTTRASVWQSDADGSTPQSRILDRVVAAAPRQYADLGCGTGAFAARVADALPAASVIAIDNASAMVDAASERGLISIKADIAHLSLETGRLDVATALWMLYHTPDPDAALAECRRVVRAGGLFIAATNSDAHLADLKRDAVITSERLPFSSENGATLLARHFTSVDRIDLTTRAHFVDHASAVAYLATMGYDTTRLAPWQGPRDYAGHVTIFACS